MEEIINNKKAVLSVVLGSYNRKNFLKLTIAGIREELKKLNFNTEIIVIDGGSADGTINWLTQQKDIISIIQHNRGLWNGKPVKRRSWGYFMNIAFKAAQGKYICMLSDDCLVIPDAIVNGYNLFETKLSAGENVGGLAFYFRDWPEEKKYRVNYTIDSTMMINHGLFLKTALEKVDYINETDFFFYHADDDLALKLKHAGYIIEDSPNSFIEHFLHANIVLRQNIFESEKQDYNSLIKNWGNIYKIENEENIHFSTFNNDFIFKHPYLKNFHKLYQKDLSNNRKKQLILKTKISIKNIFGEIYYIFKYLAISFVLLFTKPKQFIKKISLSYKKYLSKK